MATIAYDLFDGSGDLNGRTTPSGHTWVGVIPSDGLSNRMTVAGGRLTNGAVANGSDLDTAERAYIDVPFAWGLSVEYGVYWPTDGVIVDNRIRTGLCAPDRVPLGVFDSNRFGATDSSSDAYKRDASLGRILHARSYFQTSLSPSVYTWVVKALQLGLGFDYLTNTNPPINSIGVESGLNKIRVSYDDPDGYGASVYLNGLLLFNAGLRQPEDADITGHRFLVQVAGEGSAIDYIAIYEGTSAWDGSTGGGGGGGGGEPERGWWTNLRKADQET